MPRKGGLENMMFGCNWFDATVTTQPEEFKACICLTTQGRTRNPVPHSGFLRRINNNNNNNNDNDNNTCILLLCAWPLYKN